MYSVNLKKRLSNTRRKRLRCASDTTLLHFVIRYSAVLSGISDTRNPPALPILEGEGGAPET
jgi:hypothetical protein